MTRFGVDFSGQDGAAVGEGTRRTLDGRLLGPDRSRWADDAGHEDGADSGEDAHHGHGQRLAAQGEDDAGDGRAHQAGPSFCPPGHHVGRGELVGRAHDGGQQGRLGRPGDRQGERAHGGQQVDRDGRCADTDADGETGEGQRLQGVAGAEHPARTAAVGEGADERGEQDAGDELHQGHGHACRRATPLIGEDEQDEPDSELGRGEQGVGQPHPPERGVAECGAEDRQDEVEAPGHDRVGPSLCRL